MSIESAVARVEAIRTGLQPPAPAAAATTTAAPSATVASAGAGLGTGAQFSSLLQGALGQQAAPGTYPHLSGDLDANPVLLQRLEALAAARGETWQVTSGWRSYQEQQNLWDHPQGYPVARPGTSKHETGNAADILIGGRPIQAVVDGATLEAYGLHPLSGDAVHVELPGL